MAKINVREYLDKLRSDIECFDISNASNIEKFNHKKNKELSAAFKLMEDCIAAQSKLLACYRTGSRPTEWVHETLAKCREAGINI